MLEELEILLTHEESSIGSYVHPNPTPESALTYYPSVLIGRERGRKDDMVEIVWQICFMISCLFFVGCTSRVHVFFTFLTFSKVPEAPNLVSLQL